MTAKEYLSQAYRIDQRIDDKLQQIGTLRDLLAKTSIVMSDMPKNQNKDRSMMEEYLIKIIDMESDLNAEIDRLVSIKADIMHTIEKVDDIDSKMVLEKRYLQFLTWEDIANDMGYTVRNIHFIHGKALNLIKI